MNVHVYLNKICVYAVCVYAVCVYAVCVYAVCVCSCRAFSKPPVNHWNRYVDFSTDDRTLLKGVNQLFRSSSLGGASMSASCMENVIFLGQLSAYLNDQQFACNKWIIRGPLHVARQYYMTDIYYQLTLSLLFPCGNQQPYTSSSIPCFSYTLVHDLLVVNLFSSWIYIGVILLNLM